MEQPPPNLENSARQAVRIPLAQIQTGRLNMRSHMDPQELSELAISMSRIGQYAPISVFATETGFELIMGHRRCAAASSLNWTHVDGYVESRDDLALWTMAWSENHDRAGVAPSDQAEYLDKIRCANGFTQGQLAAVTGMSDSQISDLLAILRYPEPLREALDAAAVALGVARALNRIEDAATQMYYLQQACEFGCTARSAEEWVRNWRLSLIPGCHTDELDDAATYAAAPTGNLVQTCVACQQPTDQALTLVAVCRSCAALITNPTAQ